MLKTISNSMGLFLLFVIILALAIMVTIIIILPKLVAKGVNVGNSITAAKNALKISSELTSVATGLMPGNPAVNILKVVEAFAVKGVDGAEQLYKASKLAGDERNAKAKEMVGAALNVLDVKITPSIQTVIDGTIEAAVLALPSIPLTEIQIQAEKVQLQATNAALVVQNQQLTTSITQLKIAVSSIQ